MTGPGATLSWPSVQISSQGAKFFCSRLWKNRFGNKFHENLPSLCDHSLPMSSQRPNPWLIPATRAATTSGSIATVCQPSVSGRVAWANRQIVCPRPNDASVNVLPS